MAVFGLPVNFPLFRVFLLTIPHSSLMFLTDEQWLLIEPLLPPLPSSRPGHPFLDRRLVLEGIFWKIATHSPWYNLPPAYPSHQSCYRYYRQWLRSGVLNSIRETLCRHLNSHGAFGLKAVSNHMIQFSKRDTFWKITFPIAIFGTWECTTVVLLYFLFRDLYTYERRSFENVHASCTNPVSMDMSV